MNKPSIPFGLTVYVPLYRCHKTVRALKIKEVIEEISSPHVVAVTFENFPVFEGTLAIEVRDKPRPKPGWYYVLYSDGYESFSPPAQFEEGYSLLVSGEGIPEVK